MKQTVYERCFQINHVGKRGATKSVCQSSHVLLYMSIGRILAHFTDEKKHCVTVKVNIFI